MKTLRRLWKEEVVKRPDRVRIAGRTDSADRSNRVPEGFSGNNERIFGRRYST